MKKVKTLCIALASMCCLSSCARDISSEIYSADHVGETSSTYEGVISHVRQVTVQDSERLEENGLGIVGGAIGGALAGNQVGKGKGNTVTTVGGALAGATAGAFAEKALKTQKGVEYVVRIENGQIMTVVQGPSPSFSEGQKVFVIVGQKGRSRIISR